MHGIARMRCVALHACNADSNPGLHSTVDVDISHVHTTGVSSMSFQRSLISNLKNEDGLKFVQCLLFKIICLVKCS